jgi:WD40 repeat protein
VSGLSRSPDFLKWRAEAVHGYVEALCWFPDSNRLAVAGADGSVVSVQPELASIESLHHHDGGTLSLDISTGGLVASGGCDGRIMLDGKVVAVPEGRDWVCALQWRPDGQRLAAARGTKVLLSSTDGELLAESNYFPSTVTTIEWSPRGVEIAAGSYGGVRILRGKDLADGEQLEWKGSVLKTVYSPDGKRLSHGNQDSSVHFWDLRSRAELEMSGYETKVRELAWSSDGRFLATGGGRAAVIWDFAGKGPRGSRPTELPGGGGYITDMSFRPNSHTLATSDESGRVSIWDLSGGTGQLHLDDLASCVAWSPDGGLLAAGDAAGAIYVLAAEDLWD